ncbi:tripartite tricarboxylate transporter substrate binding protein [Pigmentiphaga soli]|uniref:Tripartite tricarboxylate transporter substrate binding protein n=1 Tax=Pigmentiphaga soli TaxID=1007095 RepID=A0ABP8GFJ8_9BURK
MKDENDARMQPGRRAFTALALAAAAGVAASGKAAAEGSASNYPSKPIRLIAPFAPGGTVDIVSRMVGAALSRRLNQPVVVENRGGAGTIIGTEAAVRAAPDGYTLYVGVSTLTTNPGLYGHLPYDAEKDLAPISLIARMPVVPFANPAFPAKDVGQLIQYAKAHPDEVNFGSPGYGTMSGMTAELLKKRTGTRMTHIQYKGGAQSMSDTLAGHIAMTWGTVAQGVEQHKAGQLRALGVSSQRRHPLLPDVATFQEQGIDIVTTDWYGLFAPAGIPAGIRDMLNASIKAILAEPHFGDPAPAFEFVSSTPDELGALVKSETDRWTPLIRTLGIKPE